MSTQSLLEQNGSIAGMSVVGSASIRDANGKIIPGKGNLRTEMNRLVWQPKKNKNEEGIYMMFYGVSKGSWHAKMMKSLFKAQEGTSLQPQNENRALNENDRVPIFNVGNGITTFATIGALRELLELTDQDILSAVHNFGGLDWEAIQAYMPEVQNALLEELDYEEVA